MRRNTSFPGMGRTSKINVSDSPKLKLTLWLKLVIKKKGEEEVFSFTIREKENFSKDSVEKERKRLLTSDQLF